MVTIILFLVLAAALGTTCYLLLRRLFQGLWAEWREWRQEVQEEQRRRLNTQALHREALDSVLTQIGRQDEQGRKTA